MNKIDSYLNEIYIQEDMQEVLSDYKRIDKPTVMKLNAAVNPKDPKGSLQKLSKLIPSGFNGKKAITKVDQAIGMKISEYPKLKKRATIVVKNSISGVSDQMADVAGSFLAFHSLFAKKGQENMPLDTNLKNNLKIFVTKVRKFGEDYEDEKEEKTKLRPSDYADLSVAWVVIVMTTGLAVGIGAGVYVAMKIVALAVAASLPFIMNLFAYTICGVIIMAAFIFIAGKMGAAG